MRAIEWERPALAAQAYIRQRLLADHAGRAGGYDEDEVEIAVPDLADLPIRRITIQEVKACRNSGDKGAQTRRGKRRVAGAADEAANRRQTHHQCALRFHVVAHGTSPTPSRSGA